jgi:hypothetical protein
MKRAVSVSLGSPTRDKRVELDLGGERVLLERIGTNGDEPRARAMFRDLDGKVDALGVGGIDLYVRMPYGDYPLRGALRLVQDIRTTPYVDGSRLRTILERRVVPLMEGSLGSSLGAKKVFFVEAITRRGLLSAFLEAGFDCVYGDLMYALGIPIPIRTLGTLDALARILLPIVGRMPISFLYSTGESQEVVEPKYEKYYKEASIIAGDWLYIKKHMPDDMEGKTIVTNTTTPADLEFMRSRGIRRLFTTTPVFEGRSFGTNALEAALTAAAGKGRVLEEAELGAMIDGLGIGPAEQDLG